MKRILISVILIILILNSGCTNLEPNDSAIVIGLGLEWVNTDKFKISSQIARPTSTEQTGSNEESKFIVVSKTGESTILAARNLSLTLPRIPLWTYTSTLILGEKLTKKHASHYLDFLARNPNVRKNTIVVVAKNYSPEKILQTETPLENLSAQGIRQMLNIQEQQLGIYIPITIGEFIRKIITPGIEPLVPMVTIIKDQDNELIKLDGAAVFSDNYMVGHLNEKESRGYRWLQGQQEGGLFSVPSPVNPNNLVTIELSRSNAKVTPIVNDQGDITIKIEITAEGNFYEQNSTEQLLTLENFKRIEANANREIEKEISNTINRAQQLNSDIFGWGQLLNNYYPTVWAKSKPYWSEIFPNIKTDITVNFELRRSYLTTKSFQFR